VDGQGRLRKTACGHLAIPSTGLPARGLHWQAIVLGHVTKRVDQYQQIVDDVAAIASIFSLPFARSWHGNTTQDEDTSLQMRP
jgi:hypothetical protein